MKPIEITFNKDCMEVRHLKICAEALETILDQFDLQLTKMATGGYDWTPEQAEDFTSRVLQLRSSFKTRYEIQKEKDNDVTRPV